MRRSDGRLCRVIPGVMVTMLEDMKKRREEVVRSMWAAGAIGWVLATRGTFAAEVCGCQVEIGAAGAMGAGAVVEAAGGSARQAADAEPSCSRTRWAGLRPCAAIVEIMPHKEQFHSHPRHLSARI